MDNNPPAFPGQPRDSSGAPCGDHMPGMTLRDWFAGQALPQVMALYPEGVTPDRVKTIAKASYAIADVMLAGRAKATGQ